LKRRFLSKHVAGVSRFYREMSKITYNTEVSRKWRDRFEKNRDKLFTFLTYDGVPRNNNNAEHAIKAFARLRRLIVELSSPKGIEEYLILLSVCQTCRYSGVDFLDFLRSGQKDINAFAEFKAQRTRIRGLFSSRTEDNELLPVFVVICFRPDRCKEPIFGVVPSIPDNGVVWWSVNSIFKCDYVLTCHDVSSLNVASCLWERSRLHKGMFEDHDL
jgi:hypothetical protein